MILYAAGNFQQMWDPASEYEMARMILKLHQIYPRLISFAYPKHAMSVIALKKKPDIADRVMIMLDSGAYSVKARGIEIDIDDYIAFIKKHKDAIDYYINLDVIPDGDASYRNYLYMKDKDLDPIPVYHALSHPKYLQKYIKQTDYIAIALKDRGQTKKNIRNLDFLWDEYLTNSSGGPLVKVHCLGLSSPPIINKYPWHSADGTSWVQFSRFGAIAVPKKKHGKYIYDEPFDIVPVSERRLSDKRHFLNRKPSEQDHILGYLKEKLLQLRM